MKKNNRIGETKISNEGYVMTIVEYNNQHDISVKFIKPKTVIVKTHYNCFKKGGVRNPYHKSLFGIGYLGTIRENLSNTQSYKVWNSMLGRCYNINDKMYPIYNRMGAKVCREWHNYSNFKKWFDINYYKINEQDTQLDKDILIKGNKEYSPKYCCFVPKEINNLFTSNIINRGNLPIGVIFMKDRNKYRAQLSKENKKVYLGDYDTIEEAFNVYKIEKEKYIKELADKYKSSIPQKLYLAMYNYKVEITD